MPSVTTSKMPSPVAIPEEWQKANEALEAVTPKSGSNGENSSNKTEQTPVVDLPNNFDWQSTFTGYPGYDQKISKINICIKNKEIILLICINIYHNFVIS